MKHILLLIGVLPMGLTAQTGTRATVQAHAIMATTAVQGLAPDSLAKQVAAAGKGHSFAQLWQLVEDCRQHCPQSIAVGEALVQWLNEGHAIYAEKGYNETLQFRASLIYALSFFPPTDRLLHYLLYELAFADNNNIIGAALYTARIYPGNDSLIGLAEKYSTGELATTVNFTSPDVLMAPTAPTTLQQAAIGSLAFLRARQNAPSPKRSCCDATTQHSPTDPGRIPLIPRSQRRLPTGNITFYDQYGQTVQFRQLKGKPFLMTFFYTSCTNPKKCANTIYQLSLLQNRLQSERGNAGLYAISYDTYVDKPDVLRKYGATYNFAFSKHQRFLVAHNEDEHQLLLQTLQVKAGYGNGIVTQHGTQLFLFDKKGRIALQIDNEACSVDKLLQALLALQKE